MNFIRQAITIFIICIIGELISAIIPAPFPGSVIAMIVLFLCLIFKVLSVEKIHGFSEFLLQNMSLLFIPATVSIIEYLDVLKSVFWQFLFICLITTIISFVCTAYSVKAVMYLIKKRSERKEKNA